MQILHGVLQLVERHSLSPFCPEAKRVWHTQWQRFTVNFSKVTMEMQIQTVATHFWAVDWMNDIQQPNPSSSCGQNPFPFLLLYIWSFIFYFFLNNTNFTTVGTKVLLCHIPSWKTLFSNVFPLKSHTVGRNDRCLGDLFHGAQLYSNQSQCCSMITFSSPPWVTPMLILGYFRHCGRSLSQLISYVTVRCSETRLELATNDVKGENWLKSRRRAFG